MPEHETNMQCKHTMSSPTASIWTSFFFCFFIYQVTSGDQGWTSSEPQTWAGQDPLGASSTQSSIQSHQRRATLQTLRLWPESHRVSCLRRLQWPSTTSHKKLKPFLAIYVNQYREQRLWIASPPNPVYYLMVSLFKLPFCSSNKVASISAIGCLLIHITGNVLKWCNSDAKRNNLVGNSAFVTIHTSNVQYFVSHCHFFLPIVNKMFLSKSKYWLKLFNILPGDA